MPAFGLNIESISPYSVPMQENADLNNSECGHFFTQRNILTPLFLKSEKLRLRGEKCNIILATRFWLQKYNLNSFMTEAAIK